MSKFTDTVEAVLSKGRERNLVYGPLSVETMLEGSFTPENLSSL